VALAVAAWSAGCAITPKPVIEPAFAARTSTPIRIALLPPDVFTILDQLGDNDPARSEALRRQVFDEVVRFSSEAFRQRGYELDLSARWDGIVGGDGQLLVGQDELSSMADAILSFVNSPAGGQKQPWQVPQVVAPELAAKIGWATQSDTLLYVNLKGVTTSDGKRAAVILGAVFIALLVVLIVLASTKSSGGGGGVPVGRPGGVGHVAAGPALRAGPRIGGPMAVGPARGGGGPVRVGPPPVGRGPRWSGGGGPSRVYGGGPHVGVGVGVFIPLEGPTYTHEGQVTHEDGVFGDDEVYLSMTLVNAADGRVIWHLRDDFDLDADDPADIETLVRRVVETVPLRGDLGASGTAPVSVPVAQPPR
jgi:hypothetical protein